MSDDGNGRSFPVPSIGFLLLLALAVLLLADDIRLRRVAGERDEAAETAEVVPLDEPEKPPEPEHPSLLSDIEIRLLHKWGLEDPERELIADLRSHTELIPFDAVLGGTMFFSLVFVLPGYHAFALFEDGHIGGPMLLRFEVKDGAINWTVLHASLD